MAQKTAPAHRSSLEAVISRLAFAFGFGGHTTLGDIFPQYKGLSPAQIDAAAIASDWNITGKDLQAQYPLQPKNILNKYSKQ